MPASLKFYTDSKKSTEAKANLSNAKVIVYKDAGNNKYTLDASGIAGLTKIDDIAFNQLKDLKLQYEDNKGTSNGVQGLSDIVSKSIDVLDMLFTPIMAAKTDAETAKTGAEAAKTDAEKAKTDAETAKTGTEAAKTDAVKAKDDAVKAKDDAVKAKTDAETAKTGAEAAKTDAVKAKDDAVKAKTDAETAKTGAEAAKTDAEKAKDDANTTFVKAVDLEAKVAEKAVVDAITASPGFTNKVYIKADPADEVYTKTAADTALADKLNVNGSNATDPGVTAMLGKLTGDNVVVKINASNLTDAANKKAFAEAILPAKDGNKSILVDKLEGFLAENAKVYSNNTKTAKELLVPSAADLVQDHDFRHGIEKSIKEMAVSSNSDFQKNVREVMSQPSFDIPPSDDAALNWTW